eukprot:gene21367-28306_t
MVIFGPPGQVAQWFSSQLGFTHDPAGQGSVADWVLDMIAPADNSNTGMSPDRIQAAASLFHKDYMSRTAVKASGQLSLQGTPLHDGSSSTSQSVDVGADEEESSGKRSGVLLQSFWQYRVLAHRELLNMTRNPADACGRLVTMMYVGLLTGLAFCKLSTTGESYTLRLSLMFYEMQYHFKSPLLAVPLQVTALSSTTSSHRSWQYHIHNRNHPDFTTFMIESVQDLYNPFVYYLAKTTVATPLFAINGCCYILIVYGMAGLRDDASSIGQHIVMGILIHLYFSQVMHMTCILTNSMDVAFMIAIAINALNLLFSAYLIPPQVITLEVPISWLRYVSAVFYSFSGNHGSICRSGI